MKFLNWGHVWTGNRGQDVFLLFFQRCTHVSGLNSAFKGKAWS
jgi:hypothetical protein